MTQYIDKAAVVAEIDRRINENKKETQRAIHKHLEEYFEGYEDALVLFKEKFLDTLEVKEVDLKKKLSYDDYKKFFKEYPNISDDWGFEEAWTFAEYFFELGLKTADLPT